VPIEALLALSDGQYAVEVVEPTGIHRIVGVTTGIYDDIDGIVAVTSVGLHPGDSVVVPQR
jgi:hypothetical protein